MIDELELKAVVPDVTTLRTRLRAAGARLLRAGRMSDRKFDKDGELSARDEVLRIRSADFVPGGQAAQLDWKGPTRIADGGYKVRSEVECPLAGSPSDMEQILTALGYQLAFAIDRDVEYYDLHGAILRLERYPHMDDLLEVEGEPAAIEAAIVATGIPRAEFSSDALADFVTRYELRTGEIARVSDAALA